MTSADNTAPEHDDLTTAGTAADTTMARRAAAGSFLGSVVEYYDFFIYGTAAALVFNQLFFPTSSPTAGTLAALATFGVGYIARPIGAVLFGHLGDRLGRKNVLLATLLMMGAATFLIGVLPTYETIGVLAPTLLVVCRLAQGLSAGGEQTGASLLTLEHAPEKKRGLYASWMLNGAAAGSILATSVFIPIAALPEEALYSWGWRIPFLLSFVMVFVTFLVRRSVAESPEFAKKDTAEHAAGPGESRFPLFTLLSTQPGATLLVFLAFLVAAVSSVVTVFGLSFATQEHSVDRTAMLTAITLSQIVALFFHPAFGWVADRVGKKPVFVAGVLGCAVGTPFYLASIESGNVTLVIVAAVLLKGVVYAAPNGLWPSFFAEQFHAGVRYTGVGIATQLSLLITGFAPTICYALLADDGSWAPVAWFVAGLCAISAGAALVSRRAVDDRPAEQLAHS